MPSPDVALLQGSDRRQERELVVNNFSIQIATVNGSGSQSANSVLMRAIFRDGRTGEQQEPVSLEHCGTSYVVHDSREQAWL